MSSIHVTNDILEVRGKKNNPHGFNAQSLLSSGYLPGIIALVVLFTITPMLKYGGGANYYMILGVFLMLGTISLLTYLDSLRPSFRADCRDESLTWFGVTGKPDMQLQFRDVKEIQLNVCWSNSEDRGFSGTVDPGATILWYVELLDKEGKGQKILYTINEADARKGAMSLQKMLGRPVIDKSFEMMGEEGKAVEGDINEPLWKRLKATGDTSIVTGQIGELTVEADGRQVSVKIAPSTLSKEQSRLLYYIYMFGSTLLFSMLVTILSVMRLRSLPLIALGIEVFLFAVAVVLGIVIYSYERKTEFFVHVEKDRLRLVTKKLEKVDEKTIPIDELRGIRVDTFPENRLALVTFTDIYYTGNALSPDSLALLEDVIKNSLIKFRSSRMEWETDEMLLQ